DLLIEQVGGTGGGLDLLLEARPQALGGRGAEMREPAMVGLGAVGELAQAAMGVCGAAEAAELRLPAEIALLVPSPRSWIEPAEIAVPQRLERALDGAGEAVGPCASLRLEEGRRAEIRNQDAVDHVAELDVLAGIGDFDEETDLALVSDRRGAPDLPAAA